jgi:phosphoglycerate kinase
MANTFLAAKGIDMRDSLVEPEVYDVAKDLLSKASDKIHLPFDFKIADTFSEDAQVRTVLADEIPEGWQALDIGPQSVESFVQALFCAKLIVWNGPMGVFEFPAFASGTIALAKAVASSSAISVVGGGDSVAALKLAGVIDEIDHVSTGGGASLELLEGKVLPGVAVLQDR